MPNVTFSSPLHKDKTVYAVAGSHKQTILELAKENHIPIDFSCGDGECGTTGAIAGMLAGALYGRESLPPRWLRSLDPAVKQACEMQVRGLLPAV